MQKFRDIDLNVSRRKKRRRSSFWKYETKHVKDIAKVFPSREIKLHGIEYVITKYGNIVEETFIIRPGEILTGLSRLKQTERSIPIASYEQVKDLIPKDVFDLVKELGGEIHVLYNGYVGDLVVGKSPRKVYVIRDIELLEKEPEKLIITLPDGLEIYVDSKGQPYVEIGIEYKNADMVAYVPKVLYDLGLVTEEDLGISPWNARVYEEGDIAIVKQESVGGLAGEDEYRKRLTWDDVREILRHIKKGEE